MIKHIALAASLFACLSIQAKAQIEMTITEFTDSTLSFTLSGTIPDGANIGAGQGNALFIGAPGVTGWCGLMQNGDFENLSVSSRQVTTTMAVPNFNGDYIYFYFEGGTLDFVPGEAVDVSVTFSGGSWNPTAVDVNDIIVSCGYDDFSVFPDPDNQVGGVQSAPAPVEVSQWTRFNALIESSVEYQGWTIDTWFGNFNASQFDSTHWFYHELLYWLYAPEIPESTYGYWFFMVDSNQWIYTDPANYPWVFYTTDNSWEYTF